jgi:UDP-N-acetylglucosamine--N-acetylmuramyl-(pentapeptide) pyrophosphoryl-undecaprenol N-acetylglucosamine transferase
MKNLKKKVIIAAGGTGGHIIPAISIAEELIKNKIDVLFVGNKNSMEQELTAKREIAFKSINVQKFYRKITLAHLKFPFKLLKSIYDSKKIIRNFQPDAFIGTGGFVSGPVGYAAHLKKVPIFLQEQNSYPGATTRILSKYAEKIFLGNKGAKKYLLGNKLVFSGNPINKRIIGETEKINFAEFGLKENSTKLFLLGGSQGSVVLNKTFLPIVDELLENGIEIIWQIGKFSFDEFYPKIQNKKGIYSFDFTDEIGKIYNSVNFLIARAGAISLAELETKKLPSILIPLPSAAENHQYYNAMELQGKGVAMVLKQKDLTSESLKSAINTMQNNFKDMHENFKQTHHQDAVKTITNYIMRKMNI